MRVFTALENSWGELNRLLMVEFIRIPDWRRVEFIRPIEAGNLKFEYLAAVTLKDLDQFRFRDIAQFRDCF
jgi:hypothetical protein